MGKTIPKIISILALAATAGTTTLLYSNANYEEEKININDLKPLPIIEPVRATRHPWTGKFTTNWDSAKGIQKERKGTNCITKEIENIAWSEDSSEIALPEKISKFKGSISSCLIVEHYKQGYSGGKTWGEFKLVWFLKDEKQGLLTSVHVKTGKEKLIGSSVAYFLQSVSNKWEVKGRKEHQAIATTSNDLSKLIPKAGNPMGSYEINYWGFNLNPMNVCGNEDCEKIDDGSTRKMAIWNFNTSITTETTQVKDWSYDLKEWMKKTFGWGELVKKMKEVKGKWVKG